MLSKCSQETFLQVLGSKTHWMDCFLSKTFHLSLFPKRTWWQHTPNLPGSPWPLAACCRISLICLLKLAPAAATKAFTSPSQGCAARRLAIVLEGFLLQFVAAIIDPNTSHHSFLPGESKWMHLVYIDKRI